MAIEDIINDFRIVFGSSANYSDREITKIIKALYNVRCMDDYMASAHRHLLQSIKSSKNFYGQAVFPCDVIQLRRILDEQQINCLKPIVLFSTQTIKRVVEGYNCLLLLNCNPQDIKTTKYIAGGMAVIDSHTFDISDKISGIIIQRSASYEDVKQIVSETIPNCPIYSEHPVPGLNHKKVADGKSNSSRNRKSYKVRLPALKINQEVFAENDFEAVRKALSLRWDRHPDSKHQRKPARYSPEYWLYSGFWDYIVKETSSKKDLTKIAGKGIFNPHNPPNPEPGQDAIPAVMTNDEKIYYDTQAVAHFDVVESFDLEPSHIIDGGFIVKGDYVPQSSGGFANEDDDVKIYKDDTEHWGFRHVEAQSKKADIDLTPEEEQVFRIILDVDHQFNLGQQYRVAGGWVRDKLLGKESDDIDIALDQMTGQEFRQYVEQYQQNNPEAEIGKSYVVEQNPDASKHLETTAIQIGPYKIDFVNLRSENYADDSRIPQMHPGTPEEDAARRDLTINALFYNIATDEVEDYVGGLEDLQEMNLRTPMDPKQTFLDDPLRMLRVLRFHSKYNGFQIDPQTLEAMKENDVHEAYRNKVSPERAGPEILKMFQGETPEDSVKTLHETGLDYALFNIPEFEGMHPMQMDQKSTHHEMDLLGHTTRVIEHFNDMLEQNGVEGKDRALALIASWFHDFGKRHPEIGQPKPNNPEYYSYHGHEDMSAQLANKFLKNIGIGKDDREFVTTIVQEHMRPHAHSGQWGKKQMGKLKERTTIPGQERDDVWKFVMWHSHADAAAKNDTMQLEDVPEYASQFEETEQYMNQPPPAKPLVDGKRLMQMFPNLDPKTGFIRYINERLLEEQQAGNIPDQQSAENFVESIRQEVESQFGDNIKGSSMSNWYKRITVADASSSERPEGYNGGQDSETWMDRVRGQKFMKRYEPSESARYSPGDRVFSRQSGLAEDPQSEGTVSSVKNGKIKIKWDSGEEEDYAINSIELPAMVERAG